MTLYKPVLLTGLSIPPLLEDVDGDLLSEKLVILFSTQSMVSHTVVCGRITAYHKGLSDEFSKV